MPMLLQLLLNSLLLDLAVPQSETISGPNSPAEWSSWIDGLISQRESALEKINYNGSIFDVAGLDWTRSTFIQPQMHGYDAYFYDINTHSYTFNKWVTDLRNRYGGIDSFLFWVTYTNIGADDRNQFDMNLAVPGHMTGLQNIVNYFHSQTPPIYVLFPYNPWDTGTRDSGNPDYITMAQFLNDTGGDGFNGDTMGSIPEEFYTYSANKYNHPIALEPEGGGDTGSLNWDTLGWGYWPQPYQPPVGRWKWYDGRHMTNVCDRWAQNHTNDLQDAYFNGVGFESWENVWGCWNGIVPRDAESIRRAATILRYFGNRNNNPSAQNFTQSLNWLPYIPIISQKQYTGIVFASMFPVNNGTDEQQLLFLIVNRDNMDIKSLEIVFDNTFTMNSDDIHVYDCYHGEELKITTNNKQITVNIDIEGLGYGAILATMDTTTSNKDLNSFLSEMATMTQTPLNSYSSQWTYLLQTMTPIPTTTLYSNPPDLNMTEIPWGVFYFDNTGVEIEGDDSQGVDVQYKFEMHPQKEHQQYMTIPKIYMDKYPVTCSKYKQYLDSTGYKPADSYNYLKNWNYDSSSNTYSYPTGYESKPVTYLGLAEARDYCSWAKKRLPHSYEWQYAAQGNTGDLYPWGNTQGMGTNFPQQQNGRTLPGPADVTAFESKGSSMFGVSDLIGNVWQYTDEFTDNHTRSVIVRGSANYRPSGSQWYFPNAFQLNQHNKYFLMDNCYERAGTIGFRCAADAEQPTNGKPNYWDGAGTYCNNYNSTANGILCGKIETGEGFNDLTSIGGLDWIQFGINSDDNSEYKMIRKQTSSMYIGNISSSSSVSTYNNNPRGFYWNDGENDIKTLAKDDASTYGIYIGSHKLGFSVNNLSGGNMYKLRIFVGVYEERGELDVTLNIDGKTSNTFTDSTVYSSSGTADVCYEIIINLSSISSSESIQLLINWIVNSGKGNITLQAIALELIQQMDEYHST